MCHFTNSNKKKLRKTLAFILLFAFLSQGQIAYCSPLSKEALEVTRNIIASPTNQNADEFIKIMLKEYKRENRAKNYDDALDYLRSALYFLRLNPKTEAYNETYSNYNKLIQKTGLDTSQSNRLEVAKNLYLEQKYFASAYEFSKLLDEKYNTDICLEYLGDVAGKIGSVDVAISYYKKAYETNPNNISAEYKYAMCLLADNKKTNAIFYLEDVIEKTNSKEIINEIINTFNQRIQRNPDDENNYGILGLAYQKLGQYDKTYKFLKRSLIINPKDIFLRYYLGNLLFNINEYSFADEIYSEILDENPYESQIRISRAKTYAALNDENKAIKDYQVVLAMYPDSIQAQYGIYTLLKNKMPLEKIVNLFYPIEPDFKLNSEGYNNLGYLANQMGKSSDARVFFEKSLSINPKSETPYIELYKIYQLEGSDAKAREIIQKAYKLFPKNTEIKQLYGAISSDKTDEKNNLALSYINEGDFKKAIAAYNQIEPKDASTYEAIANCYRQLGDIKNAILNYQKGIELNPDNSDAYYMLGVAFVEANDFKKAKDAFNKSIQKDPKNVKSKQMLNFLDQKEIGKSLDVAYDFYDKKDYKTALSYLNKASNTFPNDAKVYYYRAMTKDALMDYQGAISDYKLAIKLDRNYVDAYYRLAEDLERTNRQKEALFMYEKYLGAENLDPELAKKAEQRVIELGERYY